MNPRFPFTPYPRGWFQVAWSEELPAGGVLPLSCFGRELVLFRTEAGEAHVLDAYCPHLGAHLGHGGRVHQGNLQCPFHGWTFNGQGACVAIPHAPKIPPGATLNAWPVQELNGVILVYHAADGAAPEWRVPALPEATEPEWLLAQKKQWRIRTHVQEISENVADPTHFRYVHSALSMPEAELSSEGHVLRMDSKMLQPTPRGPVQGRIQGEAHGLGYWVIRFSGIADVAFISAATPVGPEHVSLRHTFFIRAPTQPGGSNNVGKALVAEILRQVEEDIPIWENKVYRPKPLLSAGERAIPVLRHWSRQFLEG
ncbi:Rieske 2Fe-2S domain-containing protein [Hyalangium rubrum]|uniref:cholesterol 7-desaturase n=1 Tax=Hyalangium rubrum TaxID=3103134 RepID=A0ABU5GZU9_9BACT|nr:Rieske 2Fe-2S domain-containing protein [Hyalangium sp. s54d21]MDY7226062.1 Rieske 2Fe-2S domain-containing protein [Hyalangium sp. s54d21]